MGCDFSLTLQMAQSYMSTAGGLGSIPTPSFPRVNHRLGDYASFSLQLSVITDISFREANTEGQKYPEASFFHPQLLPHPLVGVIMCYVVDAEDTDVLYPKTTDMKAQEEGVPVTQLLTVS